MKLVLKRLSALLFMAALLGTTGCGYKGPLYLPESAVEVDSVSQN